MRPKPRPRRNPVPGIRSWMTFLKALGGLAALLLLALPTTASAARYEYEVTGFTYTVGAGQGASRGPVGGCVSGVTEDWVGNVTNSPLGGAPTGGGALKTRGNGTLGLVDFKSVHQFTFDGTHRIYENCDPPPAFAFTDTDCNDQETSGVEGDARFFGARGANKVQATWRFAMADVPGDWAPDVFTCAGEAWKFERSLCKSKVPLKTMKKQAFALPFSCVTKPLPWITIPPPGSGYSSYLSTVYVTGSVSLIRT